MEENQIILKQQSSVNERRNFLRLYTVVHTDPLEASTLHNL